MSLASTFPFIQKLQEFGQHAIDAYGYWGIFGIAGTEQFIFPLPSDPFISLGIAGGLTTWKVAIIVFLASILGSSIGYLFGRILGHPTALWLFGEKKLEQTENIVKKWGMLGVIIAGLTPIPFKIATWGAGIFEMNYFRFILAVILGRMPRYIAVIYGTQFVANNIRLEGTLSAAILGAVQGATEFLPVSSSGHLILMEHLIKVPLPASQLALFDIFLHGGSLLAILIYFWRDWLKLFQELWEMIKTRTFHPHSLPVRLAAATVPAILAALVFQDLLTGPFRSLLSIGIAFLVMGCLFFYVAKKGAHNTIEHIHLKKSILIGCAQAVALLPGVSRAGATLAAGIGLGIKQEEAARFSFLLGGVAIFAANVYALFSLDTQAAPDLSFVMVGTVISFAVSLATVFLFMRFLKKHTLRPFGVYLILLGTGVLSYLLGTW